jgi:photosystem II stability/assembly factor-like uncharacterized protein
MKNSILILAAVCSSLLIPGCLNSGEKKVADRGKWVAVESGSYQDLNAVDFVDRDHGWAVGEFGTVLKTTDGGDHWESLNTGTQKRLVFVDFVDENVGYVAMERDSILKTTNGGDSWQRTEVYNYGTFRDMEFVDKNNGFLVGSDYVDGFVAMTSDGGITWGRRIFLDWKITLLDMVTAKIGYVVSDRIGSNGARKLWKTVNGGSVWQEILLPKQGSGSGTIVAEPHFVHFSSPNTGYVFVEGYGLGSYDFKLNGIAAAYKTTDGGATWKEILIKNAASLWAIVPLEEGGFEAFGAAYEDFSDKSNYGAYAATFYSKDGSRWTAFAQNPEAGVGGFPVASISIAGDRAFAVGEEGLIIRRP